MLNFSDNFGHNGGFFLTASVHKIKITHGVIGNMWNLFAKTRERVLDNCGERILTTVIRDTKKKLGGQP